jgi:hypothetical protein
VERPNEIEATVAAFLRRFGDDCGVRLEQTLTDLGLDLQHRDAVTYEGALLKFKGVPRGTIVLSMRIPDAGRRRFTLAHEVGHYVLPSQRDSLQPCSKRSIESWDKSLGLQEAAANQFAAELLMPTNRLRDVIVEPPTFEGVKAIADICGTSLTASASRLSELTSFRMATVWSQAGRVRWYRASADFVRWVRKGDLSPESYAYDAFRGMTPPDGYESVPARAWLFEKGLKEDARILEHSIALTTYDAVLSLLLIAEEIELSDEPDLALDPDEFTTKRRRWPR